MIDERFRESTCSKNKVKSYLRTKIDLNPKLQGTFLERARSKREVQKGAQRARRKL